VADPGARTIRWPSDRGGDGGDARAWRPKIPEQLAEHLDAVCDHVVKLARAGGVDGTAPWSLGEVGVFGSFPWDSYRAAAMSSASALETLGAGQIPIVGSRPMEWGSRRLQVREGLGVLLLLGMCWAAREDAIEGTVWPHVRDSQALGMFALGGLRPDVLFQQNGAGGLGAAPTALSKTLIRRAVVALGLRHALDCEGVHRWVLTLNLQFAIPVRAFRAGGLDWLRGVGRPQAIEYLLGEQALGGTSVASESLQKTWRCLREFVRGRRGLRETVEILKAHRWASGTDWEAMLGELQGARVLDDVPAVEIRPPLTRSDPLVSIGHDQADRWLVGLSVPPADSSAVPHDQLRLLVGGRCGRRAPRMRFIRGAASRVGLEVGGGRREGATNSR